MKSTIIGLVLLFVFMAIACKNSVVSQVPDFSAKQFNGDSINIAQLAKNKVTFLNIWSTCCPPCLKELPALHRVYDKYKNEKDFAFITIALNTEEELKQFVGSTDTSNFFRRLYLHSKLDRFYLPTLAPLQYGYEIVKFKSGFTAAKFHDLKEPQAINTLFHIEGIPTTFLFDRNGKIVYKVSGDITSDPQVIHKIDSLLAH